MLLSAGQEDTLSLFIATLALGDRSVNGGQMSEEFRSVLDSHMHEDQVSEFSAIISNGDCNPRCREFVMDRSMSVIAEYGTTELLHGHILDDMGLPIEEEFWLVLKEGEHYGEPTSNESEGLSLFDQARGSSSSYEIKAQPDHYALGAVSYTLLPLPTTPYV